VNVHYVQNVKHPIPCHTGIVGGVVTVENVGLNIIGKKPNPEEWKWVNVHLAQNVRQTILNHMEIVGGVGNVDFNGRNIIKRSNGKNGVNVLPVVQCE
jgi:hypothetical protein